MKSKLTFVVILALSGLLTSLLVSIPMLSATDGVAAILDASEGDAITWTNPGDTIFLSLTDSDLNVPVKRVLLETADSTDSDQDDAVLAEVVTLENTTAVQFVILDNFPILDSNVGEALANRFTGAGADTFVNRLDVRFVASDGSDLSPAVTVHTVSATDGVVQVQFASDPGGTVTAHVLFWSAGVNTVGTESADPNTTSSAVTVTSEADPVGIGAVLTETGSDTGIFELELGMCTTTDCSDAAASPPVIEVSSEVNDTISLDYDDADSDDADASTTVDVESVDPDFDNLSPVFQFATKNDRPTLSGDVTDVDSLVRQDEDDQETIRVIMRITNTAAGRTKLDLPGSATNPRSVNPADDGTVEAITGGFSVTQLVPGDFDSNADEYFIQWWILAEDLAGNRGVSDSDLDTAGDAADTTCAPDTFNVDTSGTALGGCEPFEVRVDNVAPSISSAETGSTWDADLGVMATGTDAISTSIRVVFDEALDGSTVDLADFESTDVTIEDVDWFSDAPASVFLTVDAIDSDLEPEITLGDDLGGVSDEAGNINDEDTVDADDRIPATLTATVTGSTAASRPATDDEITVVITSDEALTGTPNVFAFRIEDDSDTAGSNEVASSETTKTGSLEWTATFGVGSPGLYNVYITATDLGSRFTDLSTLGTAAEASGVAIDIADDDVILFEVDTGIPDPATSPADEGETDNTSPFITLNFADEGSEYGLAGDCTAVDAPVGDCTSATDATNYFTTTAANVVTDQDKHGTVTITAITLDAVDISADISTDDDIEFLYKATDLALGEHDVVLTYTDEVGNEVEHFTFTFEVVARARLRDTAGSRLEPG